MKKFKVTVPATSANIGVGYDCLGVALDYYLELMVSENENIEYLENGEEFSIPLEENYIYSTIKLIEEKYNKKIPNYKVEIIKNEIPVSRGLGSSSSAIIAGILIADKFLGGILSEDDMAKLATEIEGHPDNVLPAIFGGMILASHDSENFYYSRIPFDNNVYFYVMIPDFKLSTEKARAVLPKEYKVSDLISNASKLGLLIDSFHRKNYDDLRFLLDDKVHQPYRFSLINNSEDIFNYSEKHGALGEYISGAGPTLISLNYKDDGFFSAMKKELENLPDKWSLEMKKICTKGAETEDITE
ncbi:homoserine kinase [Sebaldella termitidis]|uniref:homoserine kinase n=1 Tax=Sebaldella termitidis TaxID=826 RepID=UPI003EB6F09F